MAPGDDVTAPAAVTDHGPGRGGGGGSLAVGNGDAPRLFLSAG